ncbi:hypothetical protein HS088_TW11G00359 [Tripterygium wilfordii]|uniref:C2H2-type domain-containing protein n=1 Tax=Tripterygium wilfordii TaxID=458696 RepID=A0A7J7D1U2_TRIWF|nr:uncharacterized protein LOC120008636 [Tripterygium wilfordii]KAF5740293.1 hypothetical protein HS088_TW11G00359 [Tripterygium wilfordii]
MARPRNPKNPMKEIQEDQNKKAQKLEKSPSWTVMRGLFTSKYLQPQKLQQQQKPEKHENQKPEKHQKQNKEQKQNRQEQATEEANKKCKKMKCSGSLCSNTKVMHRPEAVTPSPEVRRKRTSMGSINNESSRRVMKTPLHELNGIVSTTNSSFSPSSNSSIGGSFRGMPFRRFSGCYECRMVVDPVLGFTRERSTICPCPECGEIFMKPENLELHQAVMHAVSELGPEDTSKNIVEIIFQSSWLKKQNPVCKIDRILKVQNTQRTISKFEEYRESIKEKANKHPRKHPRCIADGNELLRFHCTTFTCSLGLNGSSNLCNSIPNCKVCSIIKNGFKIPEVSSEGDNENGILTTATSGKAHDKAEAEDGNDKRAMLVCRVIAGRVKKGMEGSMDEYDSVAGAVGLYSNLDELYVFNPKAILPCFVVMYGGF